MKNITLSLTLGTLAWVVPLCAEEAPAVHMANGIKIGEVTPSFFQAGTDSAILYAVHPLDTMIRTPLKSPLKKIGATWKMKPVRSKTLLVAPARRPSR